MCQLLQSRVTLKAIETRADRHSWKGQVNTKLAIDREIDLHWIGNWVSEKPIHESMKSLKAPFRVQSLSTRLFCTCALWSAEVRPRKHVMCWNILLVYRKEWRGGPKAHELVGSVFETVDHKKIWAASKNWSRYVTANNSGTSVF